MDGDRKPHFAFADALRAGAILLVVFNHVCRVFQPRFFGHAVTFDWLGVWAVNCFFALSAFLLAGPFLTAALRPGGALPSTPAFLLRRALRIYPLYIVSVLFSVALWPLTGEPQPPLLDVAGHLFMLQDFFLGMPQSINGPLWTMPVDAAFYLVLPLVGAAACKLLRDVPVRRRGFYLIAGLVFIAASGLVSRHIAITIAPNAVALPDGTYVYLRNALGMAPAFVIGAFLAYLRISRGTEPYRVSLRRTLTLLAFAAFFAYLGDKLLDRYDHVALVFFDAVAAVSVGLVLFVVSEPWPILSRVAQLRVVRWLAAISYAIYLFHLPIFMVVGRLHAQPLIQAAIASVITICLALLAHRWIERPFLRLKQLVRERADAPRATAHVRILAKSSNT